jgi:hypothetical protein
MPSSRGGCAILNIRESIANFLSRIHRCSPAKDGWRQHHHQQLRNFFLTSERPLPENQNLACPAHRKELTKMKSSSFT